MGVDEFVAGRRHAGQDPEPRKGVFPGVGREYPGWYRVTANPVETVATGDNVTFELVSAAVMAETHRWPVGTDHATPRLHLEQ